MGFFQRKRAVLLAVAIGTFMSALDSSVVNIVLPKISAYFHTTLSTIEWAVMSYLLVISSLLLAYGRLGDMIGPKKVYLLGFYVFTLGSLLCGFAPTVGVLIAFRAVQAIGAGMLMAMGPAIVTDAVEPRQRGRALSVTAVAVATALTIGPVLGGALTALFGWQSIFFVNVPIGIAAVWMTQKAIPDKPERSSSQTFDFPGAAIIFAALICILLPLSLVEQYGWRNPYLIAVAGLGILLAIGFTMWERRTPSPLFDISLFRSRLFAMSNLSALLNFMAQFTIILLIPFYLIKLRGLTPERAGLLYLAMPLTTMIIAPISGILSDRMDSRYISSAGMAVMAFGMWLLSNLKANTEHGYLIVSLIIVGFGIGLFQTPNNSAIMGVVPPAKRGVAAGMLSTMRNIGMVVGVAVSGAIFTSSHDWLITVGSGQGLHARGLEEFAFVGGLHVTYIVGVVFACFAAIASLVKGSTRQMVE